MVANNKKPVMIKYHRALSHQLVVEVEGVAQMKYQDWEGYTKIKSQI